MVLFKIGLSRFIKKLFLKSNLNLQQSVAKILKSSTFMAQLHCNRWSDVADCLTLLRCKFPVRLKIPICSGIKVTKGFSIRRNLAVTTRIAINSRANFFLKWIFKLKQCDKFTLRSKNYFQFTFPVYFQRTLSYSITCIYVCIGLERSYKVPVEMDLMKNISFKCYHCSKWYIFLSIILFPVIFSIVLTTLFFPNKWKPILTW